MKFRYYLSRSGLEYPFLIPFIRLFLTYLSFLRKKKKKKALSTQNTRFSLLLGVYFFFSCLANCDLPSAFKNRDKIALEPFKEWYFFLVKCGMWMWGIISHFFMCKWCWVWFSFIFKNSYPSHVCFRGRKNYFLMNDSRVYVLCVEKTKYYIINFHLISPCINIFLIIHFSKKGNFFFIYFLLRARKNIAKKNIFSLLNHINNKKNETKGIFSPYESQKNYPPENPFYWSIFHSSRTNFSLFSIFIFFFIFFFLFIAPMRQSRKIKYTFI